MDGDEGEVFPRGPEEFRQLAEKNLVNWKFGKAPKPKPKKGSNKK